MYTFRAIQACVTGGDLFRPLNAEQRERAIMLLLTEGAEFRRVEAGDGIVAEGDPASDFYLIRLGTVRVFTTIGGREQVLRLLSAGDHFGEGALLADRPGMRSASVAALDPVELVRVPGAVFRKLCETFPVLRDGRSRQHRDLPWRVCTTRPDTRRAERIRSTGAVSGAAVARSRPDELHPLRRMHAGRVPTRTTATPGCSAKGFASATSSSPPRAGRATSRTAWKAARWMRSTAAVQHLEVVIENHCIGCGLCERNCPYGSIHMVAREQPNLAAAAHPGRQPAHDGRTAGRELRPLQRWGTVLRPGVPTRRGAPHDRPRLA